MPHGTLATLAVGLFLVAPSVPAVAQQCAPYEPDPRLEAQFGTPALTQADVLVTSRFLIHPAGADAAVYQLDVAPWTTFHLFNYPACPARDYHGQPGAGTLGSGVLVAPNKVLTAGHLFDFPVVCSDVRFVFGFGNFTPDQWVCDSDPCTLPIPAQDLYSCQSVVRGTTDDWAVVTLDRNVVGRTPLPIQRQAPFPPVSTPVTVIGHPNRVLMKVEYANVTSATLPFPRTDAHVLQGSSGSMVVNEASGEVVGIVVSGPYQLLPGCEYDTFPQCYREWFSNPTAGAGVTPAWYAAAQIP